MMTPELYGFPCGLNSMMEKQPQMRLTRQACLNAAISGPSSEHMIAGFMSIDRPCREYSGKTTRSIVAMLRRALATVATIFCVCAARSAGVTTTGNCNCTTPTTTPFGDLLRPPSPFIALVSFPDPRAAYFAIDNSPGMSRAECLALEVAIMMPSVRM